MEADAGEGAAGRRTRMGQLWAAQPLAVSAFMLSLVIALINAYYAMRGSEIVVQRPEQVLLYRDGQGEGSILALSVRVPIINAASGEHGDVMTGASVRFRHLPRVSFSFQSIADPTFVEQTTDACPSGSRCIKLPGLLISERQDDLVSSPGGSALVRHLSFPILADTCSGPPDQCQRFGNWTKSMPLVARDQMEVRVILRFYSDGERTLTCRVDRVDAQYLNRFGWATLPCTQSRVSGGSFF
jgi:hypothetical protein